MVRRTQADWLKLIEQQSQGSLSVADFCKQHQLGQTYFYKRKSDLKKRSIEAQTSTFIKVGQPKADPIHGSSIKLQYQQLELGFPVSISPGWLAELIKTLA